MEMFPEGPQQEILSSRSFGLITEGGVQSRGGLSPQNFIRDPLGSAKRRSLCLQQPPPVVSVLSTAVLQQCDYALLNFQCQLRVTRVGVLVLTREFRLSSRPKSGICCFVEPAEKQIPRFARNDNLMGWQRFDELTDAYST